MQPDQAVIFDPSVASGSEDVRARFIARTYLHLLGAIALFTAIEVWLFQSGHAEVLARKMLGFSWLAVLGGFMVVGWLATHTAHAAESRAAQYTALLLYVSGEAVIFVPMLWLAQEYVPGALANAAQVTVAGFLALTMVAFMTRRDFSFLGSFLRFGFLLALSGIGMGLVFGFDLGVGLSLLMVALAGASILFDTSNVLHHYSEDRYVAAALELFSSVALLFWYMLRLYLESDS